MALVTAAAIYFLVCHAMPVIMLMHGHMLMHVKGLKTQGLSSNTLSGSSMCFQKQIDSLARNLAETLHTQILLQMAIFSRLQLCHISQYTVLRIELHLTIVHPRHLTIAHPTQSAPMCTPYVMTEGHLMYACFPFYSCSRIKKRCNAESANQHTSKTFTYGTSCFAYPGYGCRQLACCHAMLSAIPASTYIVQS